MKTPYLNSEIYILRNEAAVNKDKNTQHSQIMFAKATMLVMKVVVALTETERSRLRDRYQKKPRIVLEFPRCYINQSTE